MQALVPEASLTDTIFWGRFLIPVVICTDAWRRMANGNPPGDHVIKAFAIQR
jgi:hypothetical protein